MSAYWVADKLAAQAKLLDMIPSGVSVGFGDSVTLFQIGIARALRERGANELVNPFPMDGQGCWVTIPMEARVTTMRKALAADVFLGGTNALTLDGKLVNTDALGNRVAGLIFGPKKAIVVVGANKIVRNVEEAVDRIKNVAAPMNAKRHNLKHDVEELPCVKTGQCSNCYRDLRICCTTVIIEHQVKLEGESEPRLSVVIVGEELGI